MNEMGEVNSKCFGIREVVDMWYDKENVDIDGSDVLELERMMRGGMDRIRWCRDVGENGGWIAERSDDVDSWEYGESYFKVGFRIEKMLNEVCGIN